MACRLVFPSSSWFLFPSVLAGIDVWSTFLINALVQSCVSPCFRFIKSFFHINNFDYVLRAYRHSTNFTANYEITKHGLSLEKAGATQSTSVQVDLRHILGLLFIQHRSHHHYQLSWDKCESKQYQW